MQYINKGPFWCAISKLYRFRRQFLFLYKVFIYLFTSWGKCLLSKENKASWHKLSAFIQQRKHVFVNHVGTSFLMTWGLQLVIDPQHIDPEGLVVRPLSAPDAAPGSCSVLLRPAGRYLHLPRRYLIEWYYCVVVNVPLCVFQAVWREPT